MPDIKNPEKWCQPLGTFPCPHTPPCQKAYGCRGKQHAAAYGAEWRAAGAIFDKARKSWAWNKAYRAFQNAANRCTNPKMRCWKDYGGRGIQFRFTGFEQFLADVGLPPTDFHSIDRKDNDGNYEPGNVRWATAKEQRMNQRRQKVAA